MLTVRELIIKLMDVNPDLIACHIMADEVFFVGGIEVADVPQLGKYIHEPFFPYTEVVTGREYGNQIAILS